MLCERWYSSGRADLFVGGGDEFGETDGMTTWNVESLDFDRVADRLARNVFGRYRRRSGIL